MNWFKMLWLNSEEREILRAGKKKSRPVINTHEEVRELLDSQPISMVNKPYKNMYFANGNLTVVMKDGSVFNRSGVDHELFVEVRECETPKEIENIMLETVRAEDPKKLQQIQNEADKQLITDNLDAFRNHPEFEIKGKEVFLKGVKLALPPVVAASFIEILEKLESMEGSQYNGEVADMESQYQALKMFWLKLALNTLPQSREDLLTFVRKNDVRITPNGNLVLYRRIVTKEGTDQKLVTFVSQEYYNTKKAGFDPRKYAVGKDGDDYFLSSLGADMPESVTSKLIGNLQVMYLELPNYETNRFTAWHGHNTDIRIGGIYKIPDTDINLDNGICAAGGLHAAAVDYNYGGFGDLPVVVLVNPSKAITVPLGETGKLRTVEMFVACVNNKEHGVHFDNSALSAFDNEYHDLSLAELEEVAKTKSFKRLVVADTVPAVSLVDLNVIKNMLKTRVKEI